MEDFVTKVGFDMLIGSTLFKLKTKACSYQAAKKIISNGQKMIKVARFLIWIGKTIKIGKIIYDFYKLIEFIKGISKIFFIEE